MTAPIGTQAEVSLPEPPLAFGTTVGADPGAEAIIEDVFGTNGDESVLEVTADDLAEMNDSVAEVCDAGEFWVYQLTKVARRNDWADAHIVGELPGNHMRIEDLRASDIGSLVSIECRVMNRTEPFALVGKAAFRCLECGERYERVQVPDSLELDKPSGCECGAGKNKLELSRRQSELIDTQQLILQDLHTASSTPNPLEMRVNVHNLLVNEMAPGDTVTVNTLVRATKNDTKTAMKSDLYLQVVGVEFHDRGYAGVEVTADDIEEFEQIAESDPHSQLAASIAPSIKGDYTLARMAALYQLVGGVRREMDDQKERENVHVAYVGDPGTGKSDIAKYVAEIAPKSVYQSADNASQVGLTASISYEDKFDETKATLTGGALVRADGGLCIIDELDKGSEAVRNCLQEPLEEQEVSVAKHDIRATLPTRCGVMLVANPDDSRFDPYEPLKDQIDINDVIWDRMDIIVPFLNTPDKERDKDIADSVLNRVKGKTADYIPPETMQKYVAHARTIDPEMTDEADEILSNTWTEWRAGSDEFRVAVGVRQLYSLVRIAEASARVRLSETVDAEDAERAVHIMNTWMSLLMTNERGQLDVDVLSGTPAPKREKKQLLLTAIDNLGGEDGAPRDDVVQVLVDECNEDRTNIQQFINGLIGNPAKSGVEQNDGCLYRADA